MELIWDRQNAGLPCGSCGACSVKCAVGFDVKGKVTDIARLRRVPEEFLV